MTEPIRIDATRALTLLREVVAEHGADHLYRHPSGEVASSKSGEVCKYQVDGAPCCLIGQALSRAGVSVDALRQMDAEEAFSSISYAESGEFELDSDAREIFYLAQNEQDVGASWGAALEVAERKAKWISGVGS